MRGGEMRGGEMRGGGDGPYMECLPDAYFSSCSTPILFIVYHTSIMPSYSLHKRTLHGLRPPPLPHSQSLQSLVLRGSVHMYVCTYVGR